MGNVSGVVVAIAWQPPPGAVADQIARATQPGYWRNAGGPTTSTPIR